MAKKTTTPAETTPEAPTYWKIKLARPVPHPEIPTLILTPMNEWTVSTAVKDALGDAVSEATPAAPGEV